MKHRLAKFVILVFIVSFHFVGGTNAFYTNSVDSTSNTFTSTCWIAPSIPVQTYPSDGYHAGFGSDWDLNPYLDWDNSTSTCPTATITYQYESYSDLTLTNLLYQSTWLDDSEISVPGTLDGFYYWRVRSKDQYGNISNFSPAHLLVVDRVAPPVPNLISPGNNTKTNSNNLIQTWQQVSDNLGENVIYEYESYNDILLTSVRSITTFNNTDHGNGLVVSKNSSGDTNGDVYWRVRGVDQSGNKSNWSAVWHFEIDNSLPDPVLDGPGNAVTSVVLNEILPDPIGSDSASKPNGEWIELYNTSGANVDVNNWHITDSDGNSVVINSSRTNTGGTIISGNSFLVVFTGGSALTLNNSGDTVNLYNGSVIPANLIDTHTYSSTPEGKSIARLPDGTGPWYDPIPTPGEPNIVTEEEKQGSASSSINDLGQQLETSASGQLETEEPSETEADSNQENSSSEITPIPSPSTEPEDATPNGETSPEDNTESGN